MDLDKLKFDDRGLIPAIVQDAETGKVLTLAYMNRESLGISLEKKLTCFWSRSRQELWLKGATSGNYQHIVGLRADCDGDALLVQVKKEGPACHLGTCLLYTSCGRRGPSTGTSGTRSRPPRGCCDMWEERLNRLYEQYGYRKFRMSKFEDYDLYARNRDFLKQDHIITFREPSASVKVMM